MSIRVLLIPLLAAAAGACAHVPRGAADAPLAARLSVTASGMDVGLSDQANIAVFAVTPGRGVALVYPALHERTTYFAGWSTLSHGADPSDFAASLARFTSSSVSTVLVLVASREPLDVRRFASGGSSLERVLGYEAYWAHDADAVIGGLAKALVAGVDEEDWAMDITAVPVTRTRNGYALLGDERFPFEQPFVTVSCSAPGTPARVMVHVEFAAYACTSADPPAGSDSTATESGNGGLSASRAGITRRTFAPATEAAAHAEHSRREPAESAGRTRATGAEGQADRRVRAPRETASEASASDRAHEGPARGAAERSGGDRSVGGGGDRRTRQP